MSCMCLSYVFCFKQKTADEMRISDWSSDVCSSDLTPIWMGQAPSVAKLVMERMDAFLSETDDRGRMPSYSKVAVAAIVGNEDGAHNVSSQIFQRSDERTFGQEFVSTCRSRVMPYP